MQPLLSNILTNVTSVQDSFEVNESGFSPITYILIFSAIGIVIFVIFSILYTVDNGKKIKELSQSNTLIECSACHSKISVGADKCPKCGKSSVLSIIKKKNKITEIVLALILIFSIFIIGIGVLLASVLKVGVLAIMGCVLFLGASLYFAIFRLVQYSELKKYLKSLPVVKPETNTGNIESLSNTATQQVVFCRGCGNQLNPGAAFCPKCGTKV